MKYLVRLNRKAINMLTLKVNAKLLWEVEQAGTRDSEKVIWHCEDVRIDARPIRELFQMPVEGDPPWQLECFGTCARGQDNAIVIRTGPATDSGN